MIALLGALAVLGLPVAALVALLKAVDLVQRRRAALIVRQIEVTDAIHREFGAIVAPTLRRARRGWRVVLPMDARQVVIRSLAVAPCYTRLQSQGRTAHGVKAALSSSAAYT